MSEVVLASASPRRRQLLSLLLADFRCLPMDVDELVKQVDDLASLAKVEGKAKKN